jgi:hypothetical protein
VCTYSPARVDSVDGAFISLELLDVTQPMGRARAARTRKPNSGHTGTISITIRARRVSWNAMKPRIHCVQTQWNPGSSPSNRRPDAVEPRIQCIR